MQEVELASHQLKAVARLHNGSILTGGVGTGKTRTAMRYYIEKEAPKRVIVITTAKKRDSLDWESEAVLHGVGTSPDATLSGVLSVDSWNNLWKYVDIQGAFFIFDEQRLVGSGKWVKSFYKIAKYNHWILLSATPGDTWLDYIPVFVANGFYKNQTEFQREHVVYSRFSKFPKVEKFIGVSQLVRHRNALLVDMPYQRHTTRVLKDVVVDHDEAIFKKVVKDRWHVFESRPLRDVAELYSVMRKVVNSDPSRLSAVRKLMTDHPRLIVFYNFDYELEILRSLALTPGTQPIPESENYSSKSGGTRSISTNSSTGSTISSTQDESRTTSTTHEQPPTSGTTHLEMTEEATSSDSTSKARGSSSRPSEPSSTQSPSTGTSPGPAQILARETLRKKAAGWPNDFGTPDTRLLPNKSSTSEKLPDSSRPWSPKTSSTPSATGSETKPPNPMLCLWNTNRSCVCLSERQEMCLSSYRNEKGDGSIRTPHYLAQIERVRGQSTTTELSISSAESSSTESAPVNGEDTTQSPATSTNSQTSHSAEPRPGDESIPVAGGNLGVKVDGVIDARASASDDSSFLPELQPVAIAEWNGHKHQEIPQTDRWVYLVQYTAGAEGWNCTATDTVVFYSLNYSYRIFEQCQGRIDRLNTPFKVLTYYILKSDSWIDKVIWKAVQLKKTFNEKSAMKQFETLSSAN